MRKTIAVMITAGVAAAALMAPAHAAKTKTVTEDWSATNPVPYPESFVGQSAGCQDGEESLTKTTHAFKAPGTGTLAANMDNFQGDWDLYVFDSNGNTIGVSEASQTIDQAPPVEQISGVRLKKGQEVSIVICNWSGGPSADAHLTYVYK